MSQVLLSVKDLEKHFPVTRGVFGREVGHVRAVDGISFEIAEGETLGLVGESGCGKTTAGRAILRLIEPTGGKVLFDGRDLGELGGEELRRMRRNMQIIFQDPFCWFTVCSRGESSKSGLANCWRRWGSAKLS